MVEITLADLENKFNIALNLNSNLTNKPIKYIPNKTKEEILSSYSEYHTENVHEGIIHVFDEQFNGHDLELIVDETNNAITEYEIIEDGTRFPLFEYDDNGNIITYDYGKEQEE